VSVSGEDISDPASARMTMNVLTVSVSGEDISDPASARMTMNVLTVSVSGCSRVTDIFSTDGHS
jgi:hypothetical protein